MTVPDTERLHFMQDMQAALSHTPKSISPKYFYDQAGSALFDRICELPEYYPTRTELSILQTHAADMARHMGEHADIIEFGAGSLQKLRLLLNAASQPARFVPMDISGLHLQTATALLKKEFPELHIQPMVGDYTSDWQLPSALPGAGKRVAFFPGSTIGNFSPQQAQSFFQNCAQHLAGGALLLGVDLIKTPD
ncbi:MAG: L-histidine N(alpha)-methyltransferase, partial [Pseudomonadota bacterium]